jgi:hypothetical protein
LHSEYPEVGIIAEYFTDETTLLPAFPEWGLNLNLATNEPFPCIELLSEESQIFKIHFSRFRFRHVQQRCSDFPKANNH